jgi:hypothetical protein
LRRAIILLTAVAVFLACGSALFADQSDYYYVNVRISKVYTHTLGYKVVYESLNGTPEQVYVPNEWFVPGGKAALIAGNDTSYPYMTVYYKGGIFDHVTIYVRPSISDPTWGTIPATAAVADSFKVQDLKIVF